MRRNATDWTRPAERQPGNFRHNTCRSEMRDTAAVSDRRLDAEMGSGGRSGSRHAHEQQG